MGFDIIYISTIIKTMLRRNMEGMGSCLTMHPGKNLIDKEI
jgi:hypothetical protein